MSWNVEYTDELGGWWATLTNTEQEDISAVAEIGMERTGSAVPLLVRRRRVEAQPYARAARAKQRPPDPRLLQVRPDSLGDPADRRQQDRHKRLYKKMIPIADRLHDEHIVQLKREGLIP